MAEGIDSNTSPENQARRQWEKLDELDSNNVDLVANKFNDMIDEDREANIRKIAAMYILKQRQYLEAVKRKTLAEKKIEILEDMAYKHPVSKLPNRNGYKKFISELGVLEFDTDITVVFVDMDNLQSINNDPEKGHEWGDEGIWRVGQALSDAVRNTDFVFSNGGDEFGIVLLDTDEGNTQIVMDRAQAKMDEHNEIQKSRTDFKIDHGFTYGIHLVEKGEDLPALIKEGLSKADNKMQEKKKERRLMYEK